MVGVHFPVEARDFSLLYVVQTASDVHPAYHLLYTGGCLYGGKTASA
jgi:hypothetical protein